MTFQPFVPTGGLAGWRFLQNTLDSQRNAHAQGATIQRDMAYFREKIGEIDTAEELVNDFRLLSVTLTAFGLGDDINSKFLIRRVLEEGTLNDDALANRLSDKRYRDLSRTFGFGDFPIPSTKISDFADRIESRFKEQRFEQDLGLNNETMRLALNAQRELSTIAEGTGSNRTKWFNIMGTAPLRKVMEGALGLPVSFAVLPIDKQLEVFQSRAESAFGTSDISELAEPKTLDRILDRFTAIDGLTNTTSGPTSPALVLLRGF